MPLVNITKERMAREVIRIVHECDAGMRQGVLYYRNALARGETVEAFNLLKRAVRLPFRIESRVQALITKYNTAIINANLALVSSYTLSELNAELAPLKIYSDALKAHYQNDGWTLEQIAADIELNSATIDSDESAPIPDTYIDDM